MKKELNRRTPTGAPTRPKQSAQEKAATSSFTASAYWKFESIPLQRRVNKLLVREMALVTFAWAFWPPDRNTIRHSGPATARVPLYVGS